jgi:hypothetical protein
MSAGSDRNPGPALPHVPRRAADRRLTIADGMILVAAIALGLAAVQASLRTMRPWTNRAARVAYWILGPSSCVAMAAVAGLLVVRLRGPHPPWRRLARQPGLVAAIAAVVGLLPGAAWSAILLRFRAGVALRFNFTEWWMLLVDFVPAVVLGSWLALALSGRWRAEPGWIDRAGRLLAVYWIVCFAVKEFYRLAMELALLVPGG